MLLEHRLARCIAYRDEAMKQPQENNAVYRRFEFVD